MLKQIIALGLLLSSSSAFARDNGGVTVGMHANLQHEFGFEGDYLSKIEKTADPSQFTLWRATLGGSLWQAEDRGLDIYGELGLCRGYGLHACIGLGYRQQNDDASYVQSTLEIGTGFLFAAYFRPMVRVALADAPRTENRQDEFEYELGVKIKWPVAVF